MDQLTQLAIKHKTDKWGKHHYTPVYFDLFHNKSKRGAVKKVLEIGVAEGAGVRMFRDFFTNAMIYGADNQDNRLHKEDRIEVFKCDQSKEIDLVKLLEKTGKDLDFVVDDGSHDPKHQLFTCLILMPYLPKSVVYVIEDVAKPEIIKELLTKYDCEIKEVGERYDDKLIIVRHKNV